MFLFADSCDNYAATADLTKTWASNTNTTNITWQSTAGRFGGGAIQFVTSGRLHTGPKRLSFDAATTAQVMVGFAFKCSDTPSSEAPMLWLQDSTSSFVTSSSPNARIVLRTGGTLALAVWGAGSTGTYNAGTVDVCDGQWHWIEARFYLHNTAGTGRLVLVVDGVTDVDVTADTIATGDPVGLDRFTFEGMASCTYLIDDFIVYDNIAGTLTGDFTAASFPLGNLKMEVLRPTGAGASTEFTPSAGANYTTVDDVNPDIDVDYVETTVVGNEDTYAFGNFATTPIAVKAVVVQMFAKNADAGSISLEARTKSNASFATGTARPLGAAYRTEQAILPRDPDTAAAWTGAGVNAAEFGFQTA